MELNPTGLLGAEVRSVKGKHLGTVIATHVRAATPLSWFDVVRVRDEAGRDWVMPMNSLAQCEPKDPQKPQTEGAPWK